VARHGRGTAWARYGMCELAFTVKVTSEIIVFNVPCLYEIIINKLCVLATAMIHNRNAFKGTVPVVWQSRAPLFTGMNMLTISKRLVKDKIKPTLEQATKAQRWSRVIALLFL
jgi:hypothetical protein